MKLEMHQGGNLLLEYTIHSDISRSERMKGKAHGAQEPECINNLSLRDPGLRAPRNAAIHSRSRLMSLCIIKLQRGSLGYALFR